MVFYRVLNFSIRMNFSATDGVDDGGGGGGIFSNASKTQHASYWQLL
jgi:hypothetical protein